MVVPVVDAGDLLAQEQALADRALGQRAELSADVVEHGALLDVAPDDASEAAIALDPEVDAPLCAVAVHALHPLVSHQLALLFRLLAASASFHPRPPPLLPPRNPPS